MNNLFYLLFSRNSLVKRYLRVFNSSVVGLFKNNLNFASKYVNYANFGPFLKPKIYN